MPAIRTQISLLAENHFVAYSVAINGDDDDDVHEKQAGWLRFAMLCFAHRKLLINLKGNI